MPISSVIGGYAKVPTMGLRRAMPGGFVKRPDGGPAIILPGGFVQIAGESDPLVGLTFTMRLQTHNGNNVPLGLWQDVAATIPATQEFDPVAAWTDELSNTGVIATQENPDKQPGLVFVNGVPCVEFDGIDDFLDHNVGGAAPASIFAVGRNNPSGSYQMLVGLGAPAGPNLYSLLAASSQWGSYLGTDVGAGSGNTVFHVMAVITRAPNDVDFYTDSGLVVNKTNGGGYDGGTGSCIGAESTGTSGFMSGPICAVMSGAVSLDQALIRSYLARPNMYGAIIGT